MYASLHDDKDSEGKCGDVLMSVKLKKLQTYDVYIIYGLNDIDERGHQT